LLQVFIALRERLDVAKLKCYTTTQCIIGSKQTDNGLENLINGLISLAAKSNNQYQQ